MGFRVPAIILFSSFLVCDVNAVENVISFSCKNQSSPYQSNCFKHQLDNLLNNPPSDITLSLGDEEIVFSGDELLAQEKAILESFLGLEKEAIATHDSQKQTTTKGVSQETSKRSLDANGFAKHDAIAKIVELARTKRIVILNESHHVSFHRIFAENLLPYLKKEGYNVFAVEAIANVDNLISKGYPIASTGAYTADAEFGNLLRKAADLNFDFFAYEAGNSNDRELSQATNIAKLLNRRKDAKIFIYVGYSHVKEEIDKSGRQWMANHLKLLTGEDPLTIDQVGGTERSTRTLSDINYQSVAGIVAETSAVFYNPSIDKYLVSDRYLNTVDLTVFHPILDKITGADCSLCIVDKNYKIKHDIYVSKITSNQVFPLVIKLFQKNEWYEHGISAIPIMVHVANSQSERFQIWLKKGAYVIVTENLDSEKENVKQLNIGAKP